MEGPAGHAAAPLREPAPQAVADRLAELGADVWAVALDLANARLAVEREALEKARAELEADRAEATELADKLAGDVEALQSRLASIEAAEAAARGEADELRGQLAAAQEQAHTAEARAQEIERRAGELRTELDRAHQDADQARGALAEQQKATPGRYRPARPGARGTGEGAGQGRGRRGSAPGAEARPQPPRRTAWPNASPPPRVNATRPGRKPGRPARKPPAWPGSSFPLASDFAPWGAYSKSSLFGVGLKLKLGIFPACSLAGLAGTAAAAGFGVAAGTGAGVLLADLVAAFGAGVAVVGAAGAVGRARGSVLRMSWFTYLMKASYLNAIRPSSRSVAHTTLTGQPSSRAFFTSSRTARNAARFLPAWVGCVVLIRSAMRSERLLAMSIFSP
jgi:hypothetical protein